MPDRFRPDAAVRRVVPSTPPSRPIYASEVNKDRTGREGSEVA